MGAARISRLRLSSVRRSRLALALASVFASAPVFSADDPAVLAAKAKSLFAEARTFEHGEGVPRDGERAAKLYCEAARLGDPEAQYSVGWMYANGRGVPRDDGLAAYFFELAARQGHEHAQRMQRFVGPAVAVMPECMKDPVDPDDVNGADVIAQAPPERRKILELVLRLAPQYGVYPRLAMAVIRAESNFNPTAISAKNAQGLMQLIPETSVRFNVKKPFDPEDNIRGGLAYLRWLLAYFKGDVALVAAAYNAGEGAVNRFRGIPPYEETRGYVKRIGEIFRKDLHPFDPTVTEPSPELPRIRSPRTM